MSRRRNPRQDELFDFSPPRLPFIEPPRLTPEQRQLDLARCWIGYYFTGRRRERPLPAAFRYLRGMPAAEPPPDPEWDRLWGPPTDAELAAVEARIGILLTDDPTLDAHDARETALWLLLRERGTVTWNEPRGEDR